MGIISMILLGIGLAMDATAVAMSNGLNDKNINKIKALIIALFFGIFQGVMPLIGYFAGSLFMEFISKITAILAFVLLGFIGGKMLLEGLKKHDEEKESNSLTIKMLILQAIATSIDALTVGIIFVDAQTSNPTQNAIIASSIIAITTFAISFVAVFVGKKFGTFLSNKAQIFGGLILIGIGCKTFIEYLITIL